MGCRTDQTFAHLQRRSQPRLRPNLRTRPIEGLVILSDFKDAGGEWEGKIYDPRAGKTYRSTLVKQADGSLKVKGGVGPDLPTAAAQLAPLVVRPDWPSKRH